jgi:uncharacterized protein YggT (Ycf19 family)
MTVEPTPPHRPPAPPAYARPPARPPESETVFALRIGRALVWFMFAFLVVAVVIMALSFILQLTNANPDASFVDWVYRSSGRVDDPFRSIYPSIQHTNGSVIDFSMLFGIVIYGLLAMFISLVVHWFDEKIHSAREELA